MADSINTNIENEIVKMEFDGRNFEKNVQDSIETIRLLNSEILNLSKASLEFQKVEDASRNIKLDGISEAVDNIQDKFSFFGRFAINIMDEVQHDMINMAKKIGNSIMSLANPFAGIADGLGAYEKYNNAIRTMFNNLQANEKYMSMTDDALIKYIEKEMDYVTVFSDETNASIDKVTDAVSKLTNAGQDLMEAQQHVVGYMTNLTSAGYSIEEANNMLYVLDTINSSGRIMTNTYNMIAKTFTPQLKKKLLEYGAQFGALTDLGNGIYETRIEGKRKQELVDAGASFRKSMKMGWLTSDIYNRAMEDYARYYTVVKQLADDLGKDYTEAYELFTTYSTDQLEQLYLDLGYTKEEFDLIVGSLENWQKAALDSARQAKTFTDAWLTAVGQIRVGWKNTFTLLFGNVLEAEKLWTGLANDLYYIFNDIATWRNELVKEFVDKNGFAYFLYGISNVLSNIGYIISGILRGIGEAFGKVINPDSMANAMKGFYEFTEYLLMDEDLLNSIVSISKLIATPFAMILKIVGKIIEVSAPIVMILHDILRFAIIIVGNIVDIISSGIDTFIDNILNNITSMQVIEIILFGVRNLLKYIENLIVDIVKIIKDSGLMKFLNDVYNFIVQKIGFAINNIKNILEYLASVFSILLNSIGEGITILVTDVINFGKKISKHFGIFSTILDKVKSILKTIRDELVKLNLFDNNLSILENGFKLISGSIYLAYTNIKKFGKYLYNNISPVFINLFNNLKKNIKDVIVKANELKIFERIGNKLTKIWENIENIFKKIGDKISKIDFSKSINSIIIFLKKIKSIWTAFSSGKISLTDAIKQIGKEVLNALTDVFNSIINFFKSIQLDKIILGIVVAIPGAIVLLGTVIYNALMSLFDNLSNALNSQEAIDKLANMINIFIQNFIKCVINLFNKLKNIGPKILSILKKIDISPITNFFTTFIKDIDLAFKTVMLTLQNLFGTKFGLVVSIILSIINFYTTKIGNEMSVGFKKFGKALNKKWFFEGVTSFLKQVGIIFAEIAIFAALLKNNIIDLNSIKVAFITLSLAFILIAGLVIIVNKLSQSNESLFASLYDWAVGFLNFLPILAILGGAIFIFIKFNELIGNLQNLFVFLTKIFTSFVSVILICFGAIVSLKAIIWGFSEMFPDLFNKPTEDLKKTKHSLEEFMKYLGTMLLGIAALLVSIVLLKFVDTEKIKKVMWDITGSMLLLMGGLYIIIGLVNFFVNKGLKDQKNIKNAGNGMKDVVSSMTTLLSTILKLIYATYILDPATMFTRMSVISLILLELVGILALMNGISKSASKNEDSSSLLKNILKSMNMVMWSMVAIFGVMKFMSPEQIDTSLVTLLSIFGGLSAMFLAMAQISKAKNIKTSTLITLIGGIALLIGEIFGIFHLLKDQDISKIESSALGISLIIGAVSLLPDAIAKASKDLGSGKAVIKLANMGILLLGIIGILSSISIMITALSQVKDIGNINSITLTLMGVIWMVSLLVEKISSSSKDLGSGKAVIKLANMGILLLGIVGILSSISIMITALSQVKDIGNINSITLTLMGVIWMVSLLAQSMSQASKDLSNSSGSIAPLITLFVGTSVILGVITAMLSILSGMNVENINASLATLSAIMLLVDIMAIVFAGAAKMIGQGSDFLAMISLFGGMSLVLLAIGGMLDTISGLDLSQIQAATLLITNIILMVSLMSVIVAIAGMISNDSIMGTIVIIGGMLLMMLGISQVLNVLADLGRSGALNQEFANSFASIMTTLVVALGVLTLIATVLGMSGVGWVVIAALGALTLALIGIAEAFKIFAAGTDLFASAIKKIAEVFEIIAKGIGYIIESFTNLAVSLTNLSKEVDPVKMLTLAGSLTALGGSLMVLGPGMLVASPGLFALSGALAAFNIPFKIFIDTLSSAWKLGKDIFSSALNFISGFTGGIDKGKKDSFKSGKELGESAVKGLNEGTDSHSPSKKAMKVGRYFVQGLNNALKDGEKETFESGKKLGLNLSNGLEDYLDINSPSKLAMQDGKYYVLGIQNGIETAIPVATEAAEKLGKKVSEGFNNAVDITTDEAKIIFDAQDQTRSFDDFYNEIKTRMEQLNANDPIQLEAKIQMANALEALQDKKSELNKLATERAEIESKITKGEDELKITNIMGKFLDRDEETGDMVNTFEKKLSDYLKITDNVGGWDRRQDRGFWSSESNEYQLGEFKNFSKDYIRSANGLYNENKDVVLEFLSENKKILSEAVNSNEVISSKITEGTYFDEGGSGLINYINKYITDTAKISQENIDKLIEEYEKTGDINTSIMIDKNVGEKDEYGQYQIETVLLSIKDILDTITSHQKENLQAYQDWAKENGLKENDEALFEYLKTQEEYKKLLDENGKQTKEWQDAIYKDFGIWVEGEKTYSKTELDGINNILKSLGLNLKGGQNTNSILASLLDNFTQGININNLDEVKDFLEGEGVGFDLDPNGGQGGSGGNGGQENDEPKTYSTGKSLFVEAQKEITTLSNLYKKFGQDESTAMFNAQSHTREYYDELLMLKKAANENFDTIEVEVWDEQKKKYKKEKQQLDYESAIVKAMESERADINKSITGEYKGLGLSKISKTERNMDYATARANIQAEQRKISSFVEGFKRLANAGLSSELASVIEKEGYWNSPTYYMLASMTNKEIQKYQEAIREAKEAFAKAQEEISNTQISINVQSFKADQAYDEAKIKKDTLENIRQVAENMKNSGLYPTDEAIYQELEKSLQSLGIDTSLAREITIGGGEVKIKAAETKVTTDTSANKNTESNVSKAINNVTSENSAYKYAGDSDKSITQGSLYKSIKDWVEEAQIDIEDKDVKHLMFQAAKNNYDTKEKVKEYFESKGYEWYEDPDEDSNEDENWNASTSKAEKYDPGITSSGVIGPREDYHTGDLPKKLPKQLEEQGAVQGEAIVQGMSNSIQEQGPDMIANLASNAEPVVVDALLNLLDNLLNNQEFKEKCLSIGLFIAAGLSTGMSSGADRAEESGESLGESAISGVSDGAGVASPSKITTKVGRYIAEGLANGISQNTFMGTEAAYNMATETTDVFKNAFSNINNMVDDELDNDWNITPVVNMDNVKASAEDIKDIFANKDVEMIARTKKNQNEDKNLEKSQQNNQPNSFVFTQNNYSPKTLSRLDIYRQTSNQFSQIKTILEKK